MLTHLADVSIRSLLLAVPAWAILCILRRKVTAALQHAVWTAVLCGTLTLFAFGQVLPRMPLRILQTSPAASAPVSESAMPLTLFDPAPEASPTPTPATQPQSYGLEFLYLARHWGSPVGQAILSPANAVYGYGVVVFAFLAQFAMGTFLVRRLLATARPISGFKNVYESESIAVPFAVAWIRPRILLPMAWREWDAGKLNAVLAHEGAHVRRRDGLVASLAALNHCLFWFHPLAWILERQLALLAEQACDESCVAALGDRERYARLLLEMAGVVEASQGRLRCHALTMAARSHIRQRIDWLLEEGRTFSRGLTWAGWAAVMACGIPVVLCAGAVELDRVHVPARRAPEPRPVLLAQAAPAASPAPPVPAPKPKTRLQFEVASIRPAAPMAASSGGGVGRSGGSGGGQNCGVQRLTVDASLVRFECATVRILIEHAYGIPQSPGLIMGPDWLIDPVAAQRFDIEAKLPQGASAARLPEMLQSLLEDRFKLVAHRGTEERPIDVLLVDKGGLKLKEAAADAEPPATDPNEPACPPQSLSCSPNIRNLDGVQTVITPLSPGVRRYTSARIGTALVIRPPGDPKTRIEAPGTTLAGLGDLLPGSEGRPVLDMTGLTGRYQVVLEWSVDINALLDQAVAASPAAQAAMAAGPITSPNADIDAAIRKGAADAEAASKKAMQDALLKLGLRLEQRKGPVETLIVDHVEKNPTEN